MAEGREALLRVEHLNTRFVVDKTLLGKPLQSVHAVNDVSFEVYPDEFLGIVGESGCGKSTLGRTVLRLIEPESGSIFYKGQDIRALKKEELRLIRQKLQMVFQDPYASLNPRMTIGEIIESPLRVYGIGDAQERKARVRRIMEMTELRPAYLGRYPHEFSGGQRQRVMIARALVLEPEFLVFDEPVSALDVSVRAQILNLLSDLRRQLHFSALFISHDLSVVKYVCDRTAVMYLGRVLELADQEALYRRPAHPYTQALLSAIPIPEADANREHQTIRGELPSPLDPPSGCPFHTRCPRRLDACDKACPELRELEPGHACACFLTERT